MSHFKKWTVCLLLLALFALMRPAQARPFEMFLVFDEFGLMPGEGIDPDIVAEEMNLQYGFDLVGQPGDTMLLFSIGNVLEPLDLAQLIREIEQQNPELVAHAGMVTYPLMDQEPIDTPMLTTDRMIAQFHPDVSMEEIQNLISQYGLIILYENPYQANWFLLSATESSPMMPFDIANELDESDLTEYAHPDFVQIIEPRETIPVDTLFGNQWHHRNTGQIGGTQDADVDTSWAWDLTMGNANVLIAVLDGGFDMTHPDLTPNLFANAGDPVDGFDNDGNAYRDDRNGWDFTGCSAASPAPGCGDNDPTGPDTRPGRHGTAVAGMAAARANNSIGVSGSCPNCQYLPLRIPLGVTASVQALAFGYAQAMGADIMTNSWGYVIGTPTTAAVVAAINNAAVNGRGGLGSVVLFAMNNPNVHDCNAPTLDISSIPNVIAVSRSDHQDRFDLSGFGNCMDVLAPGRWVTSTDMQGTAGYNNLNSPAGCPQTQPTDRNYTYCITGTSFSTPLTAGVAGLALSARNNLTRLQVQRLLQDTADKVEPGAAAYNPTTGFSTPASGNATHGYGRINAYEAVRVVSNATGGRNGVDIFLRDNNLDWGNTMGYQDGFNSGTTYEATRGRQAHWVSPDIKVDAWPYSIAPTTSQQFDAFVDEAPEAGEVNRVYVRVRNRGPVTASNVTIKLHWTHFGTALPGLPGDFWTAFPANSSDTSQVHPIGTVNLTNLAYSGASVANTAADAAQIAVFNWSAPERTEGTPNHYCLFAVASSPQDAVDATSRSRFVIDSITPNDNNVTHRNVALVDSRSSRFFDELMFVRNPFDKTLEMQLNLDNPHLMQTWNIQVEGAPLFEPFMLEPGEERLIKVFVEAPDEGMSAEIGLTQYALMEVEEEGRAMDWVPVGGAVLSVAEIPNVPTSVALSQLKVATPPAVVLPLLLFGMLLTTVRVARRRVH